MVARFWVLENAIRVKNADQCLERKIDDFSQLLWFFLVYLDDILIFIILRKHVRCIQKYFKTHGKNLLYNLNHVNYSLKIYTIFPWEFVKLLISFVGKYQRDYKLPMSKIKVLLNYHRNAKFF